MEKNGFTLIELLTVIVILIIIFIIIVPAVNNVINQSEETVYQEQINKILDAAYDMTLQNVSLLPEGNSKKYITLSELKIEGLIDDDIINPDTKEPFPDDLVISISNVGNSYKNTNNNSKKYGIYLFTVEEYNYTIKDLKANPTIVLNGLTVNSSGDYIENININEEITNVTYNATDSNANDITSKVKVRITYNNNSVSSIDTSKAGIYHIIYTVIDDNGLSNSVRRSILISDNEAPILSIPDNSSISTSIKTFDLMEGVSCTDNSGECKVSFNGKIEFGKIGKYVIEYSAKDLSGNTAKNKRVITVE